MSTRKTEARTAEADAAKIAIENLEHLARTADAGCTIPYWRAFDREERRLYRVALAAVRKAARR